MTISKTSCLKNWKRELHKAGFHERATVRKPFLSQTIIAKRLEWSRNLPNWFPEQWKNVISRTSHPLSYFQHLVWVYMWRQPKGTFDPDCFLPTIKHGGGSVMISGEQYLENLPSQWFPFMAGSKFKTI